MRGCRKLISMIVMMAMLATMTPYQALAAEPPSDAAAQENQTVAEEEGQEQEQDTQETIPEDKKESDEGQKDLEEGGRGCIRQLSGRLQHLEEKGRTGSRMGEGMAMI